VSPCKRIGITVENPGTAALRAGHVSDPALM
jgi:hypothetical protein